MNKKGNAPFWEESPVSGVAFDGERNPISAQIRDSWTC